MTKYNEKLLFKNTAMLYALQFSSYLFSFITVPYQTRILGPKIYGVIGVAVAIMAYFQLFLDFGFLLSATEDISKHRENKKYLSQKISSVAVIKFVFCIFSISLVALFCIFLNPFKKYKILYLLYIIAFCINSLLPDYFFRGTENMTAITLRTVIVRFITTVFIFVFLKSPDDYLVIPALLILGNAISVIIAYFYIFKKAEVRFCRVKAKEIFLDLKHSFHFFLSRIATTVYSATNTVILGFVDKSGVLTGYYTSADKLVATAKSGLSPISDSIYPYMIKNKNFALIKKILIFLEPVIILFCIIVGIFAKPLCVFVFGKSFENTAPILIALLPSVVAILPSYLLGFPTLSAMGLSGYANISIYFGTVVHILGLAFLFATDTLSAFSLAALTSLSEWSIMLFRAVTVYKNRQLMRRT